MPAAALCAALVVSVPAAGGAVSSGGSGEAAVAAKKCKKKKKGKRGKRRKCGKPVAAPPLPLSEAKIAISPAAYDFGLVDALYTPRHERRFTVTNTGGQSSGALIITLGGDDPEDYAVNDDGCSGTGLAGGGTCTFDVAFVPPPSGEFDCDATVTVIGTPGGSAAGTVTADGFV